MTLFDSLAPLPLASTSNVGSLKAYYTTQS